MKNLSPEDKQTGKENFYNVLGITRRDFLAGTVLAGATSGAGLGSMYFGYKNEKGEKNTGLADPVRVGWIGTGDEGNVLISSHTPSFINIKAIADIRPFNIHRAFHGDHSTDKAYLARQGLMNKYGWKTESEARANVKVYDASNGGYEALLDDPDIEAVVIALPLHLHAPVAIKAMRKGKHVLTEKLMGHSVHACKEMGRVAKDTGKYLAVGHQRHYSILYDNAVDTIKRGVIGDLHHIRAQWHRGNLPGEDSWQPPVPTERDAKQWKKIDESIAKLSKSIKGDTPPGEIDKINAQIAQLQHQLLDASVDAGKFGYLAGKTSGTSPEYPNGYDYPPIEELIRWRIFTRTGGGLMAELGSHQLDASGIFVSATHKEEKDGRRPHVHPLSVTAVGGRHIFPPDRDCDDHVYCTFEYPGPGYDKDPNKKIVVTYSSINGSGFGGYGEVVMGTKGTMILEQEAEVFIYPAKGETSTKVGVKADKDKFVLDTTSSGGNTAVVKVAIEGDGKPVSKGYTEELEHWAWCIRNPSKSMEPADDPEHFPRCHPKVAMADAIIALTTNIAMTDPSKRSDKGLIHPNHIEFKESWFDINSDDTPEGVKPDTMRKEYTA